MDPSDPRYLTNEELYAKLRQLRMKIWIIIFLFILFQVIMLIYGRKHFLFLIIIVPFFPLVLQNNKYYRELKRRNLKP